MELNGKIRQQLYLRGERPRYSLDRWLNGPPAWSARGDEEKKNAHCSCRELITDLPARSDTVLTELLTSLPLVILGLILFLEGVGQIF
jgi:hypothetical protein